MKDAREIAEAGRLLEEIGKIDTEAREGISHIGLTLKGRYIEANLTPDEREHITAVVGKIMGRQIELRVKKLEAMRVNIDWFEGVSEYAEAMRKLRQENLRAQEGCADDADID